MTRRDYWKLLWVVILLLTASMGFWQFKLYYRERAAVKLYYQRALLPAMPLSDALVKLDPRFRAVIVHGHYLPGKTVLLMHQHVNERVGLRIFTPFQVAGSSYAIMVERGWVPILKASKVVFYRLLRTGSQQVIQGTLIEPRQQAFWGKLIIERKWPFHVQNLDFASIEQYLQLQLYPFVLHLRRQSTTRFEYVSPLADLKPGTHLGYALQWLFLSVTLLIAVVLYFKQVSDESNS